MVEDPAEARLRWLSLGLFGLAVLVVVATGVFWAATSPRRRSLDVDDDVDADWSESDWSESDWSESDWSGESEGDGEYVGTADGAREPAVVADEHGHAGDDSAVVPAGALVTFDEARGDATSTTSTGGRWADADVADGQPEVGADMTSAVAPREFDGWWGGERENVT